MTTFDTDTDVIKTGSMTYQGIVTDNWMINGNPNGGYLMAMVVRAIEKAGITKTATPIVTANFISRCLKGPVELAVDKISESGHFERFEVRLYQDGFEKVRSLVTFLNDKPVDVLCRYESGPPELVAPEDCTSIPEMPSLTIYNHVDARFDPSCTGFLEGNQGDISELKGWIRLKEDRPWDYASVILLSDAFPPPVFASQGLVAWVPTIELTTNIRALPASLWLRCVFRTRFVTSGLLEEDGELWDENNTLIAISRQYAMFKRNTL